MDGKMFDGLFTALILIGVAIGFGIFVVIPWAWQYVKPFIHAITG